MNITQRLAEWLEAHWVTPAYSGWLLIGLSLFFFMAATNTLAGWLYIISGVSFALLAIAAILSERTLRHIYLYRHPIAPVSVGDQLTIELTIENPTQQTKTLIQVQDILPYVLGQPKIQAVETIPANGSYRWVYCQPTHQRGIYRWQTVNLRTAAPLGLFWCRRSQLARATAVVYPTVLPLTHCALVDEMGRDASLQFHSDRRAQAATEGLTRSLRPYRWGDPTRLVHWRTSARYGELRIRELEVFTGGQELVICLDSAMPWPSLTASAAAEFEQAVVAAASLYFYARRRGLSVKLWTAGAGLIQGSQTVLQTLADIQPAEEVRAERLPTVPIVWLTSHSAGLGTLPTGSRWILWRTAPLPAQEGAIATKTALSNSPGIVIEPEQSLLTQLQAPLSYL